MLMHANASMAAKLYAANAKKKKKNLYCTRGYTCSTSELESQNNFSLPYKCYTYCSYVIKHFFSLSLYIHIHLPSKQHIWI